MPVSDWGLERTYWPHSSASQGSFRNHNKEWAADVLAISELQYLGLGVLVETPPGIMDVSMGRIHGLSPMAS